MEYLKNERLDIAGKSMFIRSTLNILLFLFIDIKYSQKYKEKTNKINYKASISILKIGFYTFEFTLLSNYLVNIPRYEVDTNLD